MKKLMIWILMAVMLVSAVPVQAAQTEGDFVASENTQKAAAYTGWKTGSTGYKYYYIKGVKQTGWVKIDGYWYYFNGKGVMKTGWITLKSKKYYLNKAGKMYTGFRQIDSRYYFFNQDGSMYTGWRRVNNKFRYFGKKLGAMVQGKTVGGRKINQDGIWAPVVVLDPGHSKSVRSGMEPLGPGSSVMKAKDNSGTQGVATGVEEYKLNLDIGLALRKELIRRGCKVVMTRTNNTKAISCKERAMIANKNKADAYVRIHANGSEYSSSVNGAMTICTTKNSPYVRSMYSKNKKLSQCVLDAYVASTGARREYIWETDSMSGNNWSNVPTTIIEMGYMSNPAEDRRMQQPSYQKKMVWGIANGVENFFK